jgi:hypothetical protein
VSLKPLLWLLATVATLVARPAAAREAGEPIRLAWIEGDVAGMTSIFSPDGKSTIGFVEYRQHRRGDILEAVRTARAQSARRRRFDLALKRRMSRLEGRHVP